MDITVEKLTLVKGLASEAFADVNVDLDMIVERWFEENVHRNSREGRVFGVVGPAGVGKSIFLAHLCEKSGVLERAKRLLSGELRKSHRRERNGFELCVGAFHFFRFEDEQYRTVFSCIKSIAKQLAFFVPELTVPEGIENVEDTLVLFQRLLATPLQQARKPGREMIVVIDAVDEAYETDQLLQIIEEWDRAMPSWVGLLVSCRPGIPLQCETFVLAFSREEHVSQVEQLVARRVSAASRKLNSKLTEKEEREKATKSIQRVVGSSLAVANVLLRPIESEEHSLSLTDFHNLQVGVAERLDAFFKRLVTKFLRVTLRDNHVAYETLMAVFAVARSPLSSEWVHLIIAQENLGVGFDQIEQFFLLDKEADTFTLPHPALAEFVLSKSRCGYLESGETDVRQSLFVTNQVGCEVLVSVLEQHPDSPLTFRHLMYNLCQLRQWDKVAEHLLDFDWVLAAISHPGVAAQIVEDMDEVYCWRPNADPSVVEVVRTIQLGLESLVEAPHLLLFNLIGRNLDASHPIFRSYASSDFAKSSDERHAFLPTSPSFFYSNVTIRRLDNKCSRSVAAQGDRLVASRDCDVFLWNIKTAKCVRVLQGHLNLVKVVAIDGDTVISSCTKCEIRLWDWSSGRCLRILSDIEGMVNYLAVHGDTFVSAHSDYKVRVWDRCSGTCQLSLEISWISGVAFNDEYVFSTSHEDGGMMRVWDRGSGVCEQEMKGFESVACCGDVIVAGSKGFARLWNGTFPSATFMDLSLAFEFQTFAELTCTSEVVTGAVTGPEECVLVWDVETCTLLACLKTYGRPYPIAVSGGNKVILGYAPMSVWEYQHGDGLSSENKGATKRVSCDGDRAITTHKGSSAVYVWNLSTRSCVHVLRGHTKEVTSAIIQGEVVVSSSEDDTVRIWDVCSGVCVTVLNLDDRLFHSCEIAIQSNAVICYSFDRLGSWNLDSKGWSWKKDPGEDEDFDYVAVGKHNIVVGTHPRAMSDGRPSVWVLDCAGTCLHVFELDNNVNALAIHEDLVVVAAGSTIQLWNMRTGAFLFTLLRPGEAESCTTVAPRHIFVHDSMIFWSEYIRVDVRFLYRAEIHSDEEGKVCIGSVHVWGWTDSVSSLSVTDVHGITTVVVANERSSPSIYSRNSFKLGNCF